MPAVQHKTLGTLRADLSVRLGFGAAGAAAGVNQPNLNSIIEGAQTLLYWTHDWARLRTYVDDTLGAQQHRIDYPDALHPDRIKALAINTGTDDAPSWSSGLQRGINTTMYTTQSNTGPARRWEPYDQIEVWPKADRAYPIRVFGIKRLDPLMLDEHRTTIDSDLVFLMALGTAKGHYRQPDAKLHMDNAAALLARLKAKSWGKDVFSPYDYVDCELQKPRVV